MNPCIYIKWFIEFPFEEDTCIEYLGPESHTPSQWKHSKHLSSRSIRYAKLSSISIETNKFIFISPCTIIKSKIDLDCYNKLNNLEQINKVPFEWLLEHVGKKLTNSRQSDWKGAAIPLRGAQSFSGPHAPRNNKGRRSGLMSNCSGDILQDWLGSFIRRRGSSTSGPIGKNCTF